MEAPGAWSILTSVGSGVVAWLDFVKSVLSSLAWPVTVVSALLLFRRDIIALLSKLAAIKAGSFEASFAQQVHRMDPLPASPREEDGATSLPQPAEPSPSDMQGGEGQEPVEGKSASSINEGEMKVKLDVPSSSDDDALPNDAAFSRTIRDFAASVLISRSAKKDFKEARMISPNSASGAVLLAWRAVEGVVTQLALSDASGVPATRPDRRRWKSPRLVVERLFREEVIDNETFERFLELQSLRNAVAHASNFSANTGDVLEYIDRAEELATTLSAVLNQIEHTMRPVPNVPISF